jgi:hypothetical protein
VRADMTACWWCLHVGLLHANKTNSETLKFTTRQVVNVTVLYLSEFYE